jgi:hypothetical protein
LFWLQWRKLRFNRVDAPRRMRSFPGVHVAGANRSADPNDAFFTDGIHDDLLTQVSRIKAIKAISRTSVMGYRGTAKMLAELSSPLADVAEDFSMIPIIRTPNSFLLLSLAAACAVAQPTPVEELAQRSARLSAEFETAGLADPFRGVTTNGTVQPGLFKLEASGVSTEPVRIAAAAFLATLTPEQRAKTMFAVEDDEWRKWMNQDFYRRQGIGFLEMSDVQREAAFGLMQASLSAEGLKLSRDIMHLDTTLGELNNGNFTRYGETRYWITVMGEPSATAPWGWQIDGHHLVINYFVLGDQVVMSPVFLGSEPVVARSGRYAGTSILQQEQAGGLALLRALDDAQRAKAVLSGSKPGNNNVGEAFKDNVVLDYAGLPAASLNSAQREQLVALVALYVDNMDEGHARVRLDEVRAHLDETHFAWIGGSADDSVFYYRIHSPVVLIEFDHQMPVGIRHLVANPKEPLRDHIHVVVRTPNGNDYGKDLLRQHYEQHPH